MSAINIESLREAADRQQRKTVDDAVSIATTGDAMTIIGNAERFAKLDKAGYAKVKVAIKSRFTWRQFSCRDLDAAVKEKQRQHRRTHRIASSDDRPEVMLGTDEARVNTEVIEGLAKRDRGIYHRGGILARIITTEDTTTGGIHRSAGSHCIGGMPVANLRERITDHVVLIQEDAEGEQHTMHPPDWMAKGIHSRGAWLQFPYLQAISDAPFIRADGSVCITPGYDTDSKVFLTPGAIAAPIPDNPTLHDAEQASARLLDLVSDFAFDGDEDQRDEYRAAWLAGLLTPFARQAFTGPAPLILVDANVPGAGKTKLPGIAGRIFMGRTMPTAGYAHDSSEMSKRITTIARDGDQLVLLDNVAGQFGNEALDRALTTTAWKERILGQSAQVDAPLLATWWATANNAEIVGDTIRRILHVRLNVASDHPEDRSGPADGKTWKYANLEQHVAENYQKYRADALTILAGYFAADKPVTDVKPFGSFEGWSRIVRQAVLWAGLADPCNTRTRLAENSDTGRAVLGDLLESWHNVYGENPMRVADVLGELYPNGKRPEGNADFPKHDRLRSAIETAVGTLPGRAPDARRTGILLRSKHDRVIDGRVFIKAENDHGRHAAQWFVQDTKSIPPQKPHWQT